MFTRHCLHSLRLLTVLLALTIMIGSFASAPSATATDKGTWTNCGDYVCTTYISKKETKVWAEYFESLAAIGKVTESTLCGAGLPLFRIAQYAIPGVAAGIACESFFSKYGLSAWHSASQRAVDRGGCLQVEKRHKGKIYKPGSTTSPRYCMP